MANWSLPYYLLGQFVIALLLTGSAFMVLNSLYTQTWGTGQPCPWWDVIVVHLMETPFCHQVMVPCERRVNYQMMRILIMDNLHPCLQSVLSAEDIGEHDSVFHFTINIRVILFILNKHYVSFSEWILREQIRPFVWEVKILSWLERLFNCYLHWSSCLLLIFRLPSS